MKIVVDDKIPYIQPALHQLAEEVVAKPGSAITSDDVREADILIVRTRTRCNRALLSGSRVRLIVTATIGYDHLDIDFHDCPLVKAWQKQGCTDEEIRLLCDHAMCGDRGIAESFGCHLNLPKTIARGDDICQIRFERN